MSGSASRRVRKGIDMFISALLETAEPGSEVGDVIGDILLNSFETAIEKLPSKEGVNDADMMQGVGVLVYQLAANFDETKRRAFASYLLECISESAKFEGRGDEDGLQLGFNE